MAYLLGLWFFGHCFGDTNQAYRGSIKIVSKEKGYLNLTIVTVFATIIGEMGSQKSVTSDMELLKLLTVQVIVTRQNTQ